MGDLRSRGSIASALAAAFWLAGASSFVPASTPSHPDLEGRLVEVGVASAAVPVAPPTTPEPLPRVPVAPPATGSALEVTAGARSTSGGAPARSARERLLEGIGYLATAPPASSAAHI